MLLQLNIATNCASEDHHDKPGHLFHRLNHQLRQVGLAANFAGGDAVCQRHDKEEKIISGTMPLINGEGMTVC